MTTLDTCCLKKEIAVHFNIDFIHYLGLVSLVFAERLKHKAIESQNEIVVFFVYYSSVFMHELSHYIVAYITGGKPTDFTVTPIKTVYIDENNREFTYWEFGHVKPRNINFINSVPIGLAPLFLLFFGYYVYEHFFDFIELTLWSGIAFYYFIFSLISSSIPSVTDFKIAFFSVYSFLFSGFVFLLCYVNFNFLKEIYYGFKKIAFSLFV